jgi:putative endonuclease
MKGINKDYGKEGEDIAIKLLEKKGYLIIEKNYRFGKSGEIDIIAEDPNGYLVFTEVKFRGTEAYGDPEYAITRTKQNQIKRLAAAYLYEKDISEQLCRFDVVTIKQIPGKESEINHYIDAFR